MILTWSEIYSVEEKYSRCVYNQKDRLPSKGIKDVKRGRLRKTPICLREARENDHSLLHEAYIAKNCTKT